MTPSRIIAALLLSANIGSIGCYQHKPVKIDKANIASITYDSRKCQQDLDKRIVCNGVVFNMKIDAREWRRK